MQQDDAVRELTVASVHGLSPDLQLLRHWTLTVCVGCVIYDIWYAEAKVFQGPSGSFWMPSPRGTPPSGCTVMAPILGSQPVNCTVLHKCLPLCLLSQMCICVTAALSQMILKCICICAICAITALSHDIKLYMYYSVYASVPSALPLHCHRQYYFVCASCNMFSHMYYISHVCF